MNKQLERVLQSIRSSTHVTSDRVATVVGFISTGAHSVDVNLGNASPDHSQCCAEETGSDSPERGESDVLASKEGVDDEIEDGNKNLNHACGQFGNATGLRSTHDERNGVDVVDDIVRHAVQLEPRSAKLPRDNKADVPP